MSQTIEAKVPDLGDFGQIPVIEICVELGNTVTPGDALVTLESDKATMDVPSSAAGVIKEICVKLGDRVAEGAVVAIIEAAAGEEQSDEEGVRSEEIEASDELGVRSEEVKPASAPLQAPATPLLTPHPSPLTASKAHASPSVRFYARELGVDLARVPASGAKGRIVKEDITAFVKTVMNNGLSNSGGGLDLLPWPKVDFAKFGEVEIAPLSRIRKISGQNLARNWVMIPAVTYHEDADITELEAFRVKMNQEREKAGDAANIKITLLAFLIKACERGLRKFPEFNSSLDGANLVLKKYFHIAFAADTPNGLVVPVVKNVDQKSVAEIAVECGELADKARRGKLSPSEMSGGCFTISSVGGIGGTAFSPIVNAPEVAILGASRSVMKPVWNGKEFAPRLILPLSLSADHRVIDGVQGTRFTACIAQLLADMRPALLG